MPGSKHDKAYVISKLHNAGAQPSTGKPVFIRPELKKGPLARAAAAAAAQRPAAPSDAQAARPAGTESAPWAAAAPAEAQHGGVVGRLKQQYEERTAAGTGKAQPADKVPSLLAHGSSLFIASLSCKVTFACALHMLQSYPLRMLCKGKRSKARFITRTLKQCWLLVGH